MTYQILQIESEHIDQILNERLPLKYWEFQLGIALKYEGAPPGVSFSAPYRDLGFLCWSALKYEVYDLLCEREARVPREWLNDLITGDIRNLIVAISSAITSNYNVSIGIGLPAAALIFKSGILTYCSKRPKRKPFKTVSELLLSKDQAVSEWQKDKKKKAKRKTKGTEKRKKKPLHSKR